MKQPTYPRFSSKQSESTVKSVPKTRLTVLSLFFNFEGDETLPILVSIAEIILFVLRLISEGVEADAALLSAAKKYGVTPNEIRKHL